MVSVAIVQGARVGMPSLAPAARSVASSSAASSMTQRRSLSFAATSAAAAARLPSSSTPSRSSLLRNTVYSNADFRRAAAPLIAKSSLLAGTPFSMPVSSRNFSLWPSSKSAPETKKEELMNTAQDVKDSASAQLQSAQSTAADGLQKTEQIASDVADRAAQGVSDASASIQSTSSEAVQQVSEQLSKVDPTTATTVSDVLGSAMGLQAGELASHGLIYWSTPPGWILNLLDFVGTSTGLPWWGTIMVTTVILRTIIAPFTVSGQKNSIRVSNIQPEIKKHMDDIKHYKAAGDQMQMQKAVMDVQKLMRANNANPFNSIKPLFIQFPLMISFFWALEHVAKANVYTFAHGGPWWTMNLCEPDPTYVLPVISTLATLAVGELGFRLGTSPQSDPAQAKIMKVIFRCFIPVMGWFSSTFPSGVLIYWATTNIWSLCQMLTLQVPAVRRLVRFPKRIDHPKNPYVTKDTGFMSMLKDAQKRLGDSAPPAVKPKSVGGALPSSVGAATSSGSRSDALKEILDEKVAYESGTPSQKEADAAAQRNRVRVLKARQRRTRR